MLKLWIKKEYKSNHIETSLCEPSVLVYFTNLRTFFRIEGCHFLEQLFEFLEAVEWFILECVYFVLVPELIEIFLF